jgi:hypothetical protein
MRRKALYLLVIATLCAASIPMWRITHAGRIATGAQPVSVTAAAVAPRIELTGEPPQSIIPVAGAESLQLSVPLGTWVRRGDVIGFGPAGAGSWEQTFASEELVAARAAWRFANAAYRETQKELALSRVDIETDELETRAQVEREDLREAAERLAAANIAARAFRATPDCQGIAAPADGVLVVFDEPEGQRIGIATRP